MVRSARRRRRFADMGNLRAEERDWGPRESASLTLTELIQRAAASDEESVKFLLPELMLAAAQGKLPLDLWSTLRAPAQSFVDDDSCRDAMRLGLHLLDRAQEKLAGTS